jgi:transcriptional regulator GlxA family with amidase domain
MAESGCGTAPGVAEAESSRRIWRSIAYMLEHLDQPLDVATLAAHVSVSASHYFAMFRRATGRPPIGYFIRLRMRRACDLLAGTSLTVKQIADSLGYDDQFYFSRVFKSIHRIPPSEYRIRLAERRKTILTATGSTSDAAAGSGSPHIVPEPSHDVRPSAGSTRVSILTQG